MNNYSFQFCQKIAVFSEDNTRVLLARRKDEADLNGVFSFIGGKMETTDKDIIEGICREKNEEVGENFKIRLYPTYTTLAFFIKKDGSKMILPHYYARYVSGNIALNQEYSEYQWIEPEKLEKFEPKVPNIYQIAQRLLKYGTILTDEESVVI